MDWWIPLRDPTEASCCHRPSVAASMAMTRPPKCLEIHHEIASRGNHMMTVEGTDRTRNRQHGRFEVWVSIANWSPLGTQASPAWCRPAFPATNSTQARYQQQFGLCSWKSGERYGSIYLYIYIHICVYIYIYGVYIYIWYIWCIYIYMVYMVYIFIYGIFCLYVHI